MSREERRRRCQAGDASDQERYRSLQSGYREALLVQLDLALTELEEQGDFTPEQIEAAVRIRLEQGRDSLRSHKLAEEWDSPGRSV